MAFFRPVSIKSSVSATDQIKNRTIPEIKGRLKNDLARIICLEGRGAKAFPDLIQISINLEPGHYCGHRIEKVRYHER